MNKRNLILLCPFICFHYAFGIDVKSGTDLKILKESQNEFMNVKTGELFEIKKGESAYIIPDESLPFLLFVPESENSQINLNAVDLKKISDQQILQVLGKKINEVILGLRKAEFLMHKKDYSQALQNLTSLKEKYPTVASVFFLSASINLLSKNRSQALEDVQRGLILDPEDEKAKKLLKELQGINK
jgi:tetratricopeptide (TPR) repeat protein